MASGPITSWQIDGETVETMRHLIFLGSKISAKGEEAVPGPSVFPSGEPGISGNFRGRIKGAKYRFPLQDGTWDFPGDAVGGKGLIL